MIELRHASQRGHADHGWLNSYHTFSFADYFDPEQIGFSDLRVINDDRVAPGRGFGRHPHRDMEIFSYVLEGRIEHRDSMDNGSVIVPGDVQLMSAGQGVLHSEFNPSETDPVHFLQIWIVPDRVGYTPRYLQSHFSTEQKRGRLRMLLAPEGEGEEATLPIRQDVRVYAGLYDGDERETLTLAEQRFAYVHLASGRLVVNGQQLEAGDGARLRGVGEITVERGEQAEVLIFDLRPNELPAMPG
ncbi:pirin family protein [Halotalea alkalilenta]|uniref:pirin family protein n=1 Tax=Halotalea alkalilenta TaxID=376489 RepID=UPI00048462DE|nr:pirin family protein [Halotalea alkalilenta]